MDLAILLQAVSALVSAAYTGGQKTLYLRIDLATGGIKQAKSLGGLAFAQEENKNDKFREEKSILNENNWKSAKDRQNADRLKDKKDSKR